MTQSRPANELPVNESNLDDSDYVLAVTEEGTVVRAAAVFPAQGAGPLHERPNPEDYRGFYYSADEQKLYLSNGSDWIEIGGERVVAIRPVNTSLPVITETNSEWKVGNTLVCSDGEWESDEVLTVRKQWHRTINGVQTDIEGQTASGYTLVAEDDGAFIGCRVYAEAPNGGASANVEAQPVGPIFTQVTEVVLPANTVAPAISYSALTAGSVLTCSDGTWTNTNEISKLWYRIVGGVATAMEDQTGDTYTTTSSDVDASFRCRVTGSNDFGSTPINTASVGPITSAGTVTTPAVFKASAGDPDSSVDFALTADMNLVVIAVANEHSSSVAATGVTLGGVSATLADTAQIVDGPNVVRTEIWYVLDANLPVAGTVAATVTWASAPTDASIAVVGYSDVAAQQAPLVITDASGTSVNSLTQTPTTSYPKALVVSAVAVGNLNSISAPTHVSRQSIAAPSSRLAVGDILDAGSAGAKTVTWSTDVGKVWNRAVMLTVIWEIQGGTEPPPPPPPPGSRTVTRQPGHHETFWNLPLAVNASTSSAGLGNAAVATDGGFRVGREREFILYTDANLPFRQLRLNNRSTVSNRESMTKPDGTAADAFGQYRLPSVVNAASINYDCAAIIHVDGNTVESFTHYTDSDGIGDFFAGFSYPLSSDAAYTDGSRDPYGTLRGGGRWASKLSVLAGTIRQWEVNEDAVIRHALKLLVDSKYLSPNNSGFRWPAYGANTSYNDSASANYYAGTNAELRMGSLLCVPWSHDKTTLTNLTPLVSRIYDALKYYGGYIVDVTVEDDAYQICTEHTIPAFTTTERSQLNDIFKLLHVVTNNSASTPGGGTLSDARRAQLLPELEQAPPPPPPGDETTWTRARISVWEDPFESALRDPNSIWRRPLGQNRILVSSGIHSHDDFGIVFAEPMARVKALSTDPMRDVYRNAGWGDRCSNNGNRIGSLRFPNGHATAGGFLYCQAGGTSNNNVCVLRPDGITLDHFGAAARPLNNNSGDLHASGFNVWARYSDNPDGSTNIRGRTQVGQHGGSGLFGMPIFEHEGPGGNEITHALTFVMQEFFNFHYDTGRTAGNGELFGRGYRWPADHADSFAADFISTKPNSTPAGYTYSPANGPWRRYSGKVPDMVMGSLICLPMTTTYADVNVTTEMGRKIFRALQHYGGYPCDAAGANGNFNTAGISVETYNSDKGYISTSWLTSQVAQEINRMLQASWVVTNNLPGQTCSGGGDPVASNLHAPPLT